MSDVIEAESSTATETGTNSDAIQNSSLETVENTDVNIEDSEGSSPDDNGTMVDAITKALEEENPETVGTEPDEQIPDEETATDEPSSKKEEDVPETSGDENKPDLHDMPEGLKPKAEERFQSLVNDNKQKSEYISQATEALTNMKTAISQTGLDAEAFGGLLNFATMVNSPNPQDQEQAFNIVKAEYERQAQALGKKIEGFDSLTDRPDLRNRVDDLELTEDDALKIAHAERVVKNQADANRQSFETGQREKAEGVENKKSVSNPVVSSGASAGTQMPQTMLEAMNQALDG